MTNGRWSNVATQRSQDDGSYAFLRIFDNPTKRVYRTAASKNGETLGVSATQRVTVSSRPKPSGTILTGDLGAKKLTDCAASEQPCFKIVSSEGRRLLKFAAVTVNIGGGPLEIHGYRSTFTSTDWIASRTSYYTSGDAQPLSVPKMVFYFAGDGHNHWQIKDFDSYQVLDKSGATDLPDGDYVARVKVDGKGLIKESNEDNNTASVGITLKAGRVTVDASTATGL